MRFDGTRNTYIIFNKFLKDELLRYYFNKVVICTICKITLSDITLMIKIVLVSFHFRIADGKLFFPCRNIFYYPNIPVVLKKLEIEIFITFYYKM